MVKCQGYYTVTHQGRTFHAPGLSPWGGNGVLLDLAVEQTADGLVERGTVVLPALESTAPLMLCPEPEGEVIEAITRQMEARMQEMMQAQRMREITAAGSKIVQMRKP